MMTQKQRAFKQKYLAEAQKSAAKLGIDAYVILSQSGLETGYGDFAPGNMMFGAKDWDGINGNEQLVPTFEFNANPSLTPRQVGLDSIDSVKIDEIQSKKAGRPIYRYSGKAYFRKYATPEDSFSEHCKIFMQPNFAAAMAVKHDTEKFVREMAKHYAPGNNTYADVLLSIIKTLKND